MCPKFLSIFNFMKIKCLLAALAINALICVPVQAQDETRHEVSFSYGVLPNSIWLDITSDVIGSIFGATYDHSGVVGPIGLEYHYRTSPLIAVGAIATFANHTEDEKLKSSITRTSKNSYFSLMPSVKFNWLRRTNWGLYSKLAAGATLRHSSLKEKESVDSKKTTKNQAFFNFQVSAIGFEAGSENVRGFAELGIGEQGVGLAGVRFRF